MLLTKSYRPSREFREEKKKKKRNLLGRLWEFYQSLVIKTRDLKVIST